MCKKRKYTKMGALYSIVNAQHNKKKADKNIHVGDLFASLIPQPVKKSK